jgi:hypothetical protein
VGRTDDEAAVPAIDIEFLPNFRYNVSRGAERDRLLHVDATPKGQFVAELSLQASIIHRFRLDGIENVQTDVNQIGDDWLDVAIRVEGEDDVAANLAPLTEEIVISGFEIFAEELGRDEHIVSSISFLPTLKWYCTS